MKKNLFFLLLFSLFFFPFDSFALSFVDCKNVEHEVQYNNFEDLRDWCYFTYYDDTKYSDLIVFHRRKNAACLMPESDTTIYYSPSDITLHAYTPRKYRYLQISNFDSVEYDYNDAGITNIPPSPVDFSSVSINNEDGSLYFNSNYSFNDIKTKYSCSSPDEPTPDNPTPDEPDTTPSITQNDFYVLMFLLSTLIWLLYFKWCFPNTRGRDL